MSKKSQMTKMLQTLQSQLIELDQSKGVQKSKPAAKLNVSNIPKASFLDECDAYGNPLHSTALEEDFSPNICSQETTDQEGLGNGGGTTDQEESDNGGGTTDQEGLGNGGGTTDQEESGNGGGTTDQEEPGNGGGGPSNKASSDTPKTTGKGQLKGSAGKAVRRKGPERKKNVPNTMEVKPTARAQEEIGRGKGEEDLTEAQSRAPASQKMSPASQKNGPASQKKAPASQKKAPRSQKKTLVRMELDSDVDDLRRVNEEKGDSSVSLPGSGSQVNQRKRRVSLSSEDLTDEDLSWHPSKKSRPIHLGQQRKTSVEGARRKSASSDSSKGSTGSFKRDKRRQKNVTNPSGLNVVLDSFLEFVSEYMDALDSGAVKQAIRAMSSLFEDQLLERITASKELKSIKRENIKMNAVINRKRVRLLEAKNELIRSESQLRALQKDRSELEQRLADLQKGTTFLKNLSHLYKTYQEYRTANPDQEDEYGPSSLPALLLEARDVLGTEDHLKTVNERLQQALDKVPH